MGEVIHHHRDLGTVANMNRLEEVEGDQEVERKREEWRIGMGEVEEARDEAQKRCGIHRHRGHGDHQHEIEPRMLRVISKAPVYI